MVDYAQDPNFVGWLTSQIDKIVTGGGTAVNVSSLGILPANSPGVNDAGFSALKSLMLGAPATTWRPQFPPGAYTYTNNRWLFNVQKCIIDAFDCTFQCTSTDANVANAKPLFNGDPFDESGDTPWPHVTYINGSLFNTAAAGATSVTTTTAADAGNFTPGMRVLLHGYDQQQSGYPPNLRYFEAKVVLTANAGTGVVTFTDPLRFAYDSRWWDTANYGGTGKAFGAPRILSLERASYKRPQLVWIKGAQFLANPTTPAAYDLQTSADLVLYEDVNGVGFNVVSSDRAFLQRCKFIGDVSSGDKLVDTLVIDSCVIDSNPGTPASSLVDCVGCNNVVLARSRFYGGINNIAPRNLALTDCDVIPAAGTFAGVNTESFRPLFTLSLRNTRVFNTGGGLSYGCSNKASPGFSLTVGSVVGTDILLTFDATGKLVADEIEYGMTLTNTVTGNTGIITAIYLSGGNLRISGTWSAPAPADVFSYYDVIQASDGGGNAIIGVQVPFWRGPPGPSLSVHGASAPAQVTGFGSPTGAGVINNFPGATATLAQCSQSIAQIIKDLKALGFYGN